MDSVWSRGSHQGMQMFQDIQVNKNVILHWHIKDKNTQSSQEIQKRHLRKLNVLYTARIYFNILKATYDKPRTNILVDTEKLKSVPVTSAKGNDILIYQVCSTF